VAGAQPLPGPQTPTGAVPQPGAAPPIAPVIPPDGFRQRLAVALDDFNRVFRPASRGEQAPVAANIIRARAAENAQVIDRIHAAMAESRDFLSRFSHDAQREFIAHIEGVGGRTIDTLPTPELKSTARLLRQALDLHADALIARGHFRNPDALFENYFPHIWKDPQAAKNFYASIVGKSPSEGSKAFLKERVLQDFEAGVARGLEPVSWNPVDLVEMKLAEINKFLTAQNIMDELAQRGMLRTWKPGGGERWPAGYAKINDPVARVYGVGEYIVPQEVAQVINNYLSPGLRDQYGSFRSALNVANSVNQFQLGMSFFHGLFTSMDAAVSTFSVGLQKVVSGKASGVADMARGLTLVEPAINNVRFGNKIYAEWMKPGSHPEVAPLVGAMREAGGRAQLHPFYQTDYGRRVKDLWRQGNVAGAALRAPQAVVEAIAKPLMEWFVPRQKLGVFGKMAEFELSRMTPEQAADRDYVRKMLGRAWDSVDNRMGQLVYDNLFWNKAAKDLAMISMRSVGWNIGTLRELAGGVTDYARQGAKLAKGKPREMEFTPRMAYVASLPVVVGTIGALTQYALTGKGPEQALDYFFPRTGKLDEYQRPERISLPSYIKDVAHLVDAVSGEGLLKGAAEFAATKMHPFITMFKETVENKDFYGVQVFGEDDPVTKQGIDFVAYLAKSFTPFGLRNIQQEAERGNEMAQAVMRVINPGYQPSVTPFDQGAGTVQKAMGGFGSFVGITPAPAYIRQSPMERKLSHYSAEKLPQGGRTREEYDRTSLLRRVERKARMGGPIAEDLSRAAQAGKVGPQNIEQLATDLKKSNVEAQLARLSLDQSVRVLELASPEEFSKLARAFANKLQTHGEELLAMPAEKRGELMRRVRSATERVARSVAVEPPGM
jgi:hypothetical protein